MANQNVKIKSLWGPILENINNGRKYWYRLPKGEFGEMTNARTNQVIIDQSDFCTIFELERKINKMVNTLYNTKSPYKIINYTGSNLNIYFLQNWFYISVKSMY